LTSPALFDLLLEVSSKPGKNIRERFREMVSREDHRIDLAEAALLIAAEEYPRLDVEIYKEKLDYFGDIASSRARGSTLARDIISALNLTLFEDIGFHGNRDHYYDPRNSFLNEVIDRRTGIPITLTIVYMEVALRTGFAVRGVGLPGHFIAKCSDGAEEIYIDPFNGGRVMGEIGCAELLLEMSGGRLKLDPSHLAAVTNRQILARMLSNLLAIYGGSNDYTRALAVIERILIITPDSTLHIRDHGLLLAALGEPARAASELERYLALAPDAKDTEAIRKQIAAIRQGQAKLN
jgi:regulator of sirC expression with transglutaminase-like and TPR domain